MRVCVCVREWGGGIERHDTEDTYSSQRLTRSSGGASSGVSLNWRQARAQVFLASRKSSFPAGNEMAPRPSSDSSELSMTEKRDMSLQTREARQDEVKRDLSNKCVVRRPGV